MSKLRSVISEHLIHVSFVYAKESRKANFAMNTYMRLSIY